MRRIAFLLITAVFCLGITVNAQENKISEQKAQEIAKEFVSGKSELFKHALQGRSSTSLRLVYTGESNGIPRLYAYNLAGGGFVIISADKRTRGSVLGYSEKGHIDFNNMPENAKSWIEGYVREITKMDSAGTTTVKPHETATQTQGKAIEPLLGETEWGQGRPYDMLCPADENGTNAATGCVATAMAQVMYYHKWPEHGKGIGYCNWEGEKLQIDLEQSVYNWDKMLPAYINSSTEAQYAVAQLMRDCGYAVHMSYGVNQSSASTSDIPNALIYHFDYDASLKFLSRYYYSDDEWEAYMCENLEKGLPILYSGVSESGGHEFVCDGYDGKGMFHFNFGWGGLVNGYFLSSVANGYSDGQYMVCDIKKNEGGKRDFTFRFQTDFAWDPEQNVFKSGFVVWDYIEEIDFEKAMSIYDLAITYENTSNQKITRHTLTDLTPDYWLYYGSHDCFAILDRAELEDGNYIVYLEAKNKTSNEWHKGKFREDLNLQEEVELTVSNGIKTYRNAKLSTTPMPNKIEADGIYYLLDETEMTAAVTFNNVTLSTYKGEITIPERIKENGKQYTVTSIASHAFANSNGLTKVTLPKSLNDIRDKAFSCSGLTEIVYPEDIKLTLIDAGAFDYCVNLKTAYIPDGVETLWSCFNGVSIDRLEIPSSVTNLNWDFGDSPLGLKHLTVNWEDPASIKVSVSYSPRFADIILHVPAGTRQKYQAHTVFQHFFIVESNDYGVKETCVNDIYYRLYRPAMTATVISPLHRATYKGKIIIPESIEYEHEIYTVNEIDEQAFGASAVEELIVSKTVRTINQSAFDWARRLKNVYFEEGSQLESVGNQAFKSCSNLELIILPEGIKSIGWGAFGECESLVEFDIPESVIEIGNSAFHGCKKLEHVTVHWVTPPDTSDDLFDYSGINTLHVPGGTKTTYENTAPWSRFEIIIEDSTTGINNVGEDIRTDNVMYDINGRIVKNPSKGIYIINGKKILKM